MHKTQSMPENMPSLTKEMQNTQRLKETTLSTKETKLGIHCAEKHCILTQNNEVLKANLQGERKMVSNTTPNIVEGQARYSLTTRQPFKPFIDHTTNNQNTKKLHQEGKD